VKFWDWARSVRDLLPTTWILCPDDVQRMFNIPDELVAGLNIALGAKICYLENIEKDHLHYSISFLGYENSALLKECDDIHQAMREYTTEHGGYSADLEKAYSVKCRELGIWRKAIMDCVRAINPDIIVPFPDDLEREAE
jgi:hypothetical protein